MFLTWDNFTNIAKSNSVVFVLAIGATFVIISAGIDLSTASAATAAGMILGLTMDAGWSIVFGAGGDGAVRCPPRPPATGS